MTATHTPGPWSEPGTYGATRFEIIANGKSVAIVNRIEDARRIVACVNSFDGFHHKNLEIMVDGGFSVSGLSRYAKELEGQRDELLAALEGVLPFLVGDYWPGIESDERVDAARAAIAKARGA